MARTKLLFPSSGRRLLNGGVKGFERLEATIRAHETTSSKTIEVGEWKRLHGFSPLADAFGQNKDTQGVEEEKEAGSEAGLYAGGRLRGKWYERLLGRERETSETVSWTNVAFTNRGPAFQARSRGRPEQAFEDATKTSGLLWCGSVRRWWINSTELLYRRAKTPNSTKASAAESLLEAAALNWYMSLDEDGGIAS